MTSGRFFLDCETTSFDGSLISIGLAGVDGETFYAELPYCDPCSWVAEHVVPQLHGNPESFELAQKRLQKFFRGYRSIEILADWPTDFQWLLHLLMVSPGVMVSVPRMTMVLIPKIDGIGDHHALRDAEALREYVLASEG